MANDPATPERALLTNAPIWKPMPDVSDYGPERAYIRGHMNAVEEVVQWLRTGALPWPTPKKWESPYPLVQHPTVRDVARALADAIEARRQP